MQKKIAAPMVRQSYCSYITLPDGSHCLCRLPFGPGPQLRSISMNSSMEEVVLSPVSLLR